MMTLEKVRERLEDAAKNGTAEEVNYWRGYLDATVRAYEAQQSAPLAKNIEEIISELEIAILISERKCERERTGTQTWKSYRDRAVALREAIALLKTHPAAQTDPGEVSDAYHTFNELYHHRAILFSVICNDRPEMAWKSKLHADGTMFDGMFIVGIETPDGPATYHYDIDPYWDMFKVKELEHAPEWDGHTPAQAIERIEKLSGLAQPNEPMTLKELREMDCQPVFVVFDIEDYESVYGWALVCAELEYVAGINIWFNFEDYGAWRAYRHPLEEEK